MLSKPWPSSSKASKLQGDCGNFGWTVMGWALSGIVEEKLAAIRGLNGRGEEA